MAGRHLWSSVVATGGFGNLDTMLQETSHKWMAHAPYAATSKAESGLGRRMTRHIRLNQALEVISLRSAPTTQKTALGRSGSLVGSNREVQVRFVGQGLVLHEPCGEGALNCWQKWHSLAAGGRPKSCRSQCGAPAVSGWLGRLKPCVSFKCEFRFQAERFQFHCRLRFQFHHYNETETKVLKPDLIFETETRLFLLLCLLVTQVPPHVGVCHAQLMHELCMYVANVRRGVAGCTPGTPLSDVKQAARDIAEGTVTLYRKCKLTAQSSSDVSIALCRSFVTTTIMYELVLISLRSGQSCGRGRTLAHRAGQLCSSGDLCRWSWRTMRRTTFQSLKTCSRTTTQPLTTLAIRATPRARCCIACGNYSGTFCLAAWLAGCLAALSRFWLSVCLCLAWLGRPVTHQDLVHSSQYLMPCSDIGWRLAIQIDHGYSRTKRPVCDALMETNQDCFAASAIRHVRADDAQQERKDSDSAGSEDASDED